MLYSLLTLREKNARFQRKINVKDFKTAFKLKNTKNIVKGFVLNAIPDKCHGDYERLAAAVILPGRSISETNNINYGSACSVEPV